MIKQTCVLCCIVLITVFSSCSNYKNIAYFRNISDSSAIYADGKDVPLAYYPSVTIKPDDILKITISTIDASADALFNSSTPMPDVNDNTVPAQLSYGSLGNQSSLKDGYLVDKNGTIEVPVIGQLHVGGLTTDQIRDLVKRKVSVFYKEPVVNVRLTNFKVTVLGEVTRPGTYIIDGEEASVLDALGLAGDLTIYGKRENVMLLRREQGNKKKVVRLNLNNTALLSSSYFYLRQGDVLYIEPSKGKAAATDVAKTRNYTIGAALLSLLIIVASRVNFH